MSVPRMAVRRRRAVPRSTVRSRIVGATGARIVSRGIRWSSITVWCSRTWARPTGSRCSRADDIFEHLADDEEIVIIDHFAFGGPVDAPCNWFQTHENAMDPYHVFILHNAISGRPIRPEVGDLAAHRMAAPRVGRHGYAGPAIARWHDPAPRHRDAEPHDQGDPDPHAQRPRTDQQHVMGVADRRHQHTRVRDGAQSGWRSTTGPAGVRREPELVRAQRRGAPAIPRRLRDAGRPGCDHPSLRGAPGSVRPWCVDGAPSVQGTGACGGRRG